MRKLLVTAVWLGLASPAALAQAPQSAAPSVQDEADTPLSPKDAAGAWTLEANGHPVCTLRFDKGKANGGSYALEVPQACGEILPPAVKSWAPTDQGMALTDQDGQAVLGFRRWSNSLFVTYHSSGSNLQLKRGGPEG